MRHLLFVTNRKVLVSFGLIPGRQKRSYMFTETIGIRVRAHGFLTGQNVFLRANLRRRSHAFSDGRQLHLRGAHRHAINIPGRH